MARNFPVLLGNSSRLVAILTSIGVGVVDKRVPGMSSATFTLSVIAIAAARIIPSKKRLWTLHMSAFSQLESMSLSGSRTPV